MVVDGDHLPVCVIETTEVAVLPFRDVPEQWAVWGGEGDRTLATWRPMYWRYIESECARIGRPSSEDAPLVMERFQVVYREPLR